LTRSEVIKTLIVNLFPEKGIEQLRYPIPNKTNTLLVPTHPPELAFIIAHETGLNVSYIHDQYFGAIVTFLNKTVSQEKRLEMVNVFFNDLTKGVLRSDILSFFKTDIFLSPSDDLMEKHSQLEKLSSVNIKNREYYLYGFGVPPVL
jgi:hypothetical protein